MEEKYEDQQGQADGDSEQIGEDEPIEQTVVEACEDPPDNREYQEPRAATSSPQGE